MEQTPQTDIPTRKIYKENSIWGGTFLGGPLVGIYFLAENFKTFNQPGKAKKTWFLGILFTILLFIGIFSIPENVNIPNQFIPIAYTVMMYVLAKELQAKNIKAHLNTGGSLFNGWRVFAIGITGLVITLIPVLAYALIADNMADQTVTTSSKTYGTTHNTIDFEQGAVAEADIDRVAEALMKTTFFDEQVTKYVYLKKAGSRYELSISVIDGTATDPEAIQFFETLRNDLQVYFPNDKIALLLVGTTLEDVLKRIE